MEMNKEQLWYWSVGYFTGAVVVVGLLLLLCATAIYLASTASAYPYQLNLTTGELIDLNSSANPPANFSVYIITYNITYSIENITNYMNTSSFQNITNITNVYWINMTNATCYNCSYQVFVINGTNGTYYNNTELENKFQTKSDFESWRSSMTYPYPTIDEFNNLVTRVNNITSSGTTEDNDNHLSIWVAIVIGILLGLIGVGLGIKSSMDG